MKMAKTRKASDEYGVYGFDWEQVTVTRMFEHYGNRALCIETDTAKMVVYVSPKGNSIRVFPYRGKIKMVEPNRDH
jgi:hypothetical protein